MMKFQKDYQKKNNYNLEFKIGIHYGLSIGGVIGHHKPQYSLIGDTINTTARYCSISDKA